MTAQYYFDSNQQPRAFDVDMLWQMAKQDNGEIFTDLKNTKIVYDRQTGKVDLDSINSPPDVHNFYSKTDFEIFRQPIETAVSLLAKIDLLKNLKKYGDEDINKQVMQVEMQIPSLKTVAEIHDSVDKALAKIFNAVTPQTKQGYVIGLFAVENNKPTSRSTVQEAIYSALTQQSVITSKEHVTKIVSMIDERIQMAPVSSKASG